MSSYLFVPPHLNNSRWAPQAHCSCCSAPSYCYFWLMHFDHSLVSSFTYYIFEDQKGFKETEYFLISYLCHSYDCMSIKRSRFLENCPIAVFFRLSSGYFLATKTYRFWDKWSDCLLPMDTSFNLTVNDAVTSKQFTWNCCQFYFATTLYRSSEYTKSDLKSYNLFIARPNPVL